MTVVVNWLVIISVFFAGWALGAWAGTWVGVKYERRRIARALANRAMGIKPKPTNKPSGPRKPRPGRPGSETRH